MEIANDVLSILSSSAIEGRFLKLPGQLDRKLYERTDKVLRAAGGLWIRGQKAHMFPEDASERIEQIILTGSVVVPRDEFDYFPTPPAVVAAVVLAADCSAGMTVLEPSAGKGHIAKAFMDYAVVDCVEVLEQHYEVLSDLVGERGKRGIRCVSHNDFLAVEPEAFYDRVVMNPPFSKRADIHHVTHAWKFVRPGGRLVAVMPPSFMYRTDKLTRAFNDMRNAAKSMLVEELPEHSFKSSGTLVSTVLLTMDKAL
jgi:predicted RNA methylase